MPDSKSPYTITLDDDPLVHQIIARATGLNSVALTKAADLTEHLSRYQPLALFVDINLGSDVSGLDLVPTLRAAYPFTPIIVITGERSDDAIGQALAAGANDFIKKPIEKAELTARLQARLAEMSTLAGRDTVRLGPVSYSKSYKTVSAGGKTRHLSPSEALLLETLSEAAGMVVAKADLKRKVWGDLKVTDNALDKKLFDLRTALREVSTELTIKSVYRVGVALTWQDETVAKAS